MGRLAGLLAGVVYAARLVADVALIWRDVRRDLASARRELGPAADRAAEQGAAGLPPQAERGCAAPGAGAGP